MYIKCVCGGGRGEQFFLNEVNLNIKKTLTHYNSRAEKKYCPVSASYMHIGKTNSPHKINKTQIMLSGIDRLSSLCKQNGKANRAESD